MLLEEVRTGRGKEGKRGKRRESAFGSFMMGLAPGLQAPWIVLVTLSVARLSISSVGTVNLVDFCGQTIQGDGMIVNSHQESRKYYFVTMGTDCHLTMQAASAKDKIQFHFRFFLVYSLLRVSPHTQQHASSPADSLPTNPPMPPHGAGDPCHAGSYVQFYDGRGRFAKAVGPPLCGKSLPRPVLSTGNYLTLRLVTRGTQPRVDFVGDFTSFRLGFNQSQCRSEPYFTCRNGKCIPTTLVCDDKGIDNCGDGSDQSELPPAQCKNHQWRALTQHLDVTPSAEAPKPAANRSCETPKAISKSESKTGSKGGALLLLLYVLLVLLVGTGVLGWCCWSPAWFIWRVSFCRSFPCCNSVCASCQLCTHSCSRKELHVAKVSPQGAGL